MGHILWDLSARLVSVLQDATAHLPPCCFLKVLGGSLSLQFQAERCVLNTYFFKFPSSPGCRLNAFDIIKNRNQTRFSLQPYSFISSLVFIFILSQIGEFG